MELDSEGVANLLEENGIDVAWIDCLRGELTHARS